MFEIRLRNNKTFVCDESSTIFEAAKKEGIVLEHSCLSARCRSCIVKVLDGETKDVQEDLVLSSDEREEGYILSCNSKALSNINLDIEDMGDMILPKSRTLPAKISKVVQVSSTVIKVVLRLPPNSNFQFIPGQYVNIIKGNIRRSYSIANGSNNGGIEFLIKNYENGLMSKYWFQEAKENDLLRIEGPLGTFFYKESNFKNIVFLATGTGIAPVKAILEKFSNHPELIENKRVIIIWGGRYEEDLFWKPQCQEDLEFIPVLSRQKEWFGKKGYVQDILLEELSDLTDAQVYACGSNDMIESSQKLLMQHGLPKNNFYSDAFVCSN
ncbi:2Fe-2S iron-sulfur cluster binding domain-containing protein [Aquimarina sp. U1-2]|uniref:FAD-binding oxidoreductase n=1 Tax=Aquimarina sp. U1-2 TaxID=2823141 RepID=UPI001AECD66D|nr:FAD-binding oxidoreductase [Aquimarina sp. U1-2]MBP2833873.1 2Fe-2S iron-sulfur cluster binding domain-containing protein [Aquimarina sp. U1-2]